MPPHAVLTTLPHQAPNMIAENQKRTNLFTYIRTALYIMGSNPSSVNHKICAAIPLFFVYLTAITLRALLMKSNLQSAIADSFEVTTPANSWKRVTEALHLLRNNIDPYADDRFHETPLALYFYNLLLKLFPAEYMIFIVLDVAIACVLYHVAKNKEAEEEVYKEREVNKDKAGGGVIRMKLWRGCGADGAFYVVLVYLFNPFGIASCVGMSTVGLSNLFVALFLYALLQRSVLVSLWLGLSSALSLYPIVLYIPMLLRFKKPEADLAVTATNAIILLLIILNYALLQNWKFMASTYGFLLTVSDLQPNVGIFWYFFAEIFEHFRVFFLSYFQLNALFLYSIALAIKYCNHPLFLSFALLSFYTIFKSYPCVGDVGFVLSFLPLWSDLFPYTNCIFLTGMMFLLSSALGPIFSHIWLNGGLGNANFYFGATLAFIVAHTFLVINLLFAHGKREFIRNNHKNIKNYDIVLVS